MRRFSHRKRWSKLEGRLDCHVDDRLIEAGVFAQAGWKAVWIATSTTAPQLFGG